MIIRIPILTCKTCKCQFARSRRIKLPSGRVIFRFETRAIYCSNACSQKAYRLSKAKTYVSVTQASA